MALLKERALAKKYKDLTQENEELSKDINQLEQLLSSHVSTKRDRPKQEQGKKETTSIWKHGKKGKLHRYKSGSELSTSVSEPVVSTSKRSHEDGTSRVNRLATATKVQIKETAGKRNITSTHPVVTEAKVGIVALKGEEKTNISFNDSRITTEKLPKRNNESNCTEKIMNRNANASSKGSGKPKSSATSSPLCETALDELKCEKASNSPIERHTQNAKSKTLEKLIKRAGVEEKLKEFKTTTSKMPQNSRSNGLSMKVSNSSCEVSNKSCLEKKTQSTKMSLSAKAVINEAVSHPKQPTNQATTSSGKSKVEPNESNKFIKLQDSITNQKRKQILSRKQTNQCHIVPKPKPCDEEVQNWIESLKLKETQKYVDIFGDHEIDMKNVHLLTRNDLREMGINALGPLNSLCSAIDILTKEKEVKTEKDKFQEQSKPKAKGSVKKTSKAAASESSLMKTENKNRNTEEQNNATSKKKMSNVKEPENKSKRLKSSQSKAKISERTSVTISQKGRDAALKESEMAKGEGTKSVVKSVSENSQKISPKPVRKDPKKISKRKPTSVPLPKQDSAVNDFKILRRPHSARQSMAMSVAHIGLPDKRTEDVPVSRPATASTGERKSNRNELDTILNDMTHQVEALQLQPDNDPSTKQLVEMLQTQILEVQEQISALSNDIPSGKPALGARPKTASAAGGSTGLVTSALQGNLRPRKSIAQEEEKLKEELADVINSSTNSKPLSAAMTKQAILKEVRKQKDDYRKQIKHLESELSRIKHQDPMKGCEITESEVFFSDADIIGEGAFSCVYHGSYQGSEVAVKQLKIPLSSQDKNYFAAEVNLLKELRHPRIVLLMGVCTTGRLPLMVLEYMNGGSLYTYLHNEQRPTLDHAAYFQVARDVALGMNYLHLHKPSVLHLDLKSVNVLLNQHLRAKIADFGFSKLKHEAEVACRNKVKEDLKGTPAWMAPELLDAKQITTKADVYSFGIVLWEMLTRKQPYQGYSTFQILEKVRNNKRPEIPDQCPGGLAKLVKRCWEQNPGKRPSFKEILSLLDELHFPTEWRELFKVAGVPRSALQDIQSSRTLINIVTNNIEDSGVESGAYSENCEKESGVGPGLGIDKLDLDFLEPRATFRKADEARASPAWSEINVHSEHSITSVDQSSNPYNFVIGVGCDDENTIHKRHSPPPLPPTPPPVPSFHPSMPSVTNELSDGISVLSLSRLQTQGTASSGLSLHASDLLSHKSKLKPHEERQYNMLIQEQAESDGYFTVKASELQKQKDLLKSTNDPHPNQLADLTTVQPERLTGLADILKKVVNERRIVIETKESLDTSMNESSWSDYED